MSIGNTKLDKMLDRGERLSDLEAWFSTFTPTVKNKIIRWIQEDQLTNQGIGADGEVIGYYSYTTELISGGEKQQGDPYTLDDTGAFYQSMFVVVLRDAVVTEADPIKGNDNLFEKYGQNIIGLTEGNIVKLQEILKTSYIEYIKETLLRA